MQFAIDIFCVSLNRMRGSPNEVQTHTKKRGFFAQYKKNGKPLRISRNLNNFVLPCTAHCVANVDFFVTFVVDLGCACCTSVWRHLVRNLHCNII